MRVEKRWALSVVGLAILAFAGIGGLLHMHGGAASGGPPDGHREPLRAQADGSWALKLDPESRCLLHMFDSGQMDQVGPLQDLLAIDCVNNGGGTRWEVNVFIQMEDPGAAARLAGLGVHVSAQIKDIVVGRVPVDSLSLLAQQPFIRSVEASKRLRACTDVSRPEVQADRVHQGYNLPQAYRGQDVVVGVVDTGIDFTHPDFSDTNGTRILHLLEYLKGGGQDEWDKSMIDSNPAAVTQRDGDGWQGHGTHVTGIAAGGGNADPNYCGIAPEADIVFVKAIRDPDSRGYFQENDITLACDYIFQKAQALGKPAVVNLSLGWLGGPPSGRLLFEQTLSGLTGPGKIIVAAAGDFASPLSGRGIHAGGYALPGTTYGSLLIADNPTLTCATVGYEFNILSSIQVHAYKDIQGHLVWQSSTPVLWAGWTQSSTLWDLSGTTRLGEVYIDALPWDSAYVLIHDFPPGSANIQETRWLITFDVWMPGFAHMWAQFPGDGFCDTIRNLPGIVELPGDASCTTASPATAEKVISVGAYTTKVDWVDDAGNSHSSPEQLGQLVSFSSMGPTPEGQWAPDICAPGSRIAAPLSSHLTQGVGYDLSDVVQPGQYILKDGTSMAAPHVTGVVALMLQANPGLDPNRVVQILRTTARSDGFTGSNLPDNTFGWGKVDALAAVQSATSPPLAQDVTVNGTVNSPMTITLAAVDDGLPLQPGALSYTIASLPAHGQLADLGGTAISQVPATLPAFANQVVYHPDAGWGGQDRFTFYADDGGTPPFGGPSNTATVTISIVAETTVDYQVCNGADDVFLSNQWQDPTMTEINLGNYTDGFRFMYIQIPQGAIIKSAKLSVCAYSSMMLTGQLSGKIQAEAADNPPDFTGAARRLSLLTLTGVSQTWNVGATPWTKDAWYDSPDISQVIQEVVDRPGWTAGNALVLICSKVTYAQERCIWAWDGDPAKAARLTITYQPK